MKTINVGLDFGSTNTLVSFYNANADEPVSLNIFSTGSYLIPSYVACRKGSTEFMVGNSARARLGNKNYRVFRAFKMLLLEETHETLAEWGYDEVYSPERIAKEFVTQILKDALQEKGADKIDVLTLGIPEIWRKTNFEGKKIRDGKALIRRICEETQLANRIRIVTEPEAASAYYAYCYAKRKNVGYSGKILIVDYGGGTLDITLSSVQGNGQNEVGMHDMKICTEERTGAGENSVLHPGENGKIGNAGILYMESVADAALKAYEPDEDDDEDEDFRFDPEQEKRKNYPKYSAFVREIEKQLIDLRGEIQEELEGFEGTIYDKSSLEELDDIEFTTIDYRGRTIEISYGLLVRVYKTAIAPTFEEQLNIIKKYMDDHGINYSQGNSDEFQLALVGGFGTFYLVKDQLERNMGISTTANIIVGDNECEKAIAHGAALYADDIVGHIYTSPYSFGVQFYNGDGSYAHLYAFQYREQIDKNKKFWLKNKAGDDFMFARQAESFKNFVANSGRANDHPDSLELKPEYIETLDKEWKKLSSDLGDYFVLAFSIDEYDRLTIFCYEFDQKLKKKTDNFVQVTLDSLEETFIKK